MAKLPPAGASYDLHTKLEAYGRNGVRDYVVWRILGPGSGLVRSPRRPLRPAAARRRRPAEEHCLSRGCGSIRRHWFAAIWPKCWRWFRRELRVEKPATSSRGSIRRDKQVPSTPPSQESESANLSHSFEVVEASLTNTQAVALPQSLFVSAAASPATCHFTERAQSTIHCRRAVNCASLFMRDSSPQLVGQSSRPSPRRPQFSLDQCLPVQPAHHEARPLPFPGPTASGPSTRPDVAVGRR